MSKLTELRRKHFSSNSPQC